MNDLTPAELHEQRLARLEAFTQEQVNQLHERADILRGAITTNSDRVTDYERDMIALRSLLGEQRPLLGASEVCSLCVRGEGCGGLCGLGEA